MRERDHRTGISRCPTQPTAPPGDAHQEGVKVGLQLRELDVRTGNRGEHVLKQRNDVRNRRHRRGSRGHRRGSRRHRRGSRGDDARVVRLVRGVRAARLVTRAIRGGGRLLAACVSVPPLPLSVPPVAVLPCRPEPLPPLPCWPEALPRCRAGPKPCRCCRAGPKRCRRCRARRNRWNRWNRDRQRRPRPRHHPSASPLRARKHRQRSATATDPPSRPHQSPGPLDFYDALMSNPQDQSANEACARRRCPGRSQSMNDGQKLGGLAVRPRRQQLCTSTGRFASEDCEATSYIGCPPGKPA